MRELVNEVNGVAESTLRPDIKVWLEALRSGEYKQGKGSLRVGNAYCCLGVYCKINNIAFLPSFLDEDGDVCEGNRNNVVYDRLREILGGKVVAVAVGMNDSGQTFNEIANTLEEVYFNA